ncbi:type 1 glutamine amidotransferase [Veronia pacifica]|uniref:Glutamine amidotransferase domain-containing protein n=1 Tax=Veronia pacifica TaxID=1080227 RepID=A0A1C3EG27_9GAMM|nr:hypothetical protein [Veronia pacifica]ODA32180.1 hypothetical protein A8L45_14055 [Veronia pacifica]
MRIGILLCDEHYPESLDEFGTYDQDFITMLSTCGDFTFSVWRCFNSEFPSSVDECNAWVLSGSKSSVYEPLPWIESLCDFVRRADQEKCPTVGVCFGHQLIHKALGGIVEKSQKGWGIGTRPFTIQSDFSLLQKEQTISLIVVHQDQVITPADGFTCIASSEFCPFAITTKSQHILTFQPHPEFSVPFFLQLLEQLRPKAGNKKVNDALLSISEHSGGDRTLIANVIYQFLIGEDSIVGPR